MNEGGVILLVVVLIALLLLGWWIAVYNRFVRLRQHLRESWADIDVELKRQHDLIPNLVETVRGYAAHEREVLTELTRLREIAESDTQPGALGADETAIQRQLKILFVRVEAYPDLKADAHFRQLQRELALSEDRLAAARRFYNANVRELNTMAGTFPASLVAHAANVTQAEYFELASDVERVAPRVAME